MPANQALSGRVNAPVMLYCGDALDVLRTLPDGLARCCVTSPPYWRQRDYGVSGQLGLERTPEEYVAHLVAVFGEVRRVLTKDGTLWLNMGDSYANDNKWGGATSGKHVAELHGNTGIGRRKVVTGLKPKDLLMMPARVAIALQADGWWLRSEIIWSKPNAMPESVTDRPTKAHEYLFLLAKAERYFYDQSAILESVSENTHARLSQDVMAQVGSYRANGGRKVNGPMRAVGRQPGVNPKAEMGVVGREKQNASFSEAVSMPVVERNARSVWEVPTQSFRGAHFATFPEELARRCILAGSAPGDTVLDPFGGSGTVAQVATGNGRGAIYIDLNPKYLHLAEQRIGPMLCESASVRAPAPHPGRTA